LAMIWGRGKLRRGVLLAGGRVPRVTRPKFKNGRFPGGSSPSLKARANASIQLQRPRASPPSWPKQGGPAGEADGAPRPPAGPTFPHAASRLPGSASGSVRDPCDILVSQEAPGQRGRRAVMPLQGKKTLQSNSGANGDNHGGRMPGPPPAGIGKSQATEKKERSDVKGRSRPLNSVDADWADNTDARAGAGPTALLRSAAGAPSSL
jgi:hypothetical protein